MVGYSKVGSKYIRRVEGKTNYKKRLTLLRSRKARLVVRKSNLYINLQYVEHNAVGDNSKLNVLSKAIAKYGWTAGLKSLPACYLTGYLFGKEVIEKKLNKDLIFDIGLLKSHKGGRLYAALKGAVDAGLNIPLGEEVLPPEDRYTGKHIKKEELFKKVKANIDKK